MMLHRVFILLLTILFTCFMPRLTHAQAAFDYAPGTEYDSSIPTMYEVLGYHPGERITSHAGLMTYLEALAAAAPDRMKIVEYARSWEGRKLVYAFVGSAAYIGQLEPISHQMKQLADPRQTAPSEAENLMASLPAIVCLSYGVHGNEISSPDAALLTAYHLLAARNNEVVDAIRNQVLVMIDPTQNPDGRDRFIHNFETSEGLEPDASPLAAEHNEPWPGGRTNHYFFDLNRDWLALTQPETRGRVKMLQDYFPLVFVDLHEMGSDATYYFAPEAVPYNPHLAKDQRESLHLFGKNNAQWFDHYGFSYFTREIYDAFYPGYGASWPSYYGSVAMTYEQASARGLLIKRSDETTMHFRDSVWHHFVASISTAETAAIHRKKLLNDFYAYRQSAIQEGRTESIKAYILPRTGNTSAVDKLVALLDYQGVEIMQARASFQSGGRQYPAGTYVISLAQPAKRLIRTLMDVEVPMDEGFVLEQERRRRKRLGDQIYDVTAWSLPLMYNIESVASSQVVQGDLEIVKPVMTPKGKIIGGKAEVAYLVPWGTQAAGRLLASAWRADLRIFSADLPFAQEDRRYPSGTLILKVKENPGDLHDILSRLAESSGAEVFAVNTSWVIDGPNFGSNSVVHMRRPRIALAWDQPTGSNNAGATRYVIERQIGYPLTPIRTSQLRSADLSGIDVLLLPGTGFSRDGYGSELGENGLNRLKAWVRAGGTVVALGSSAVSFLAEDSTGLLETARENLVESGDNKKADTPENGRVKGQILTTEADYLKAIEPEQNTPPPAQGVLLKAKLDQDHWLAAGMDQTVHALVTGSDMFSLLKLNKGQNVAVFLSPDEILSSGFLWAGSVEQMAYKPLMMVQKHERGLAIGFTADPNFRAYMDGLNILLMNAIFRGPAHAGPQVTK